MASTAAPVALALKVRISLPLMLLSVMLATEVPLYSTEEPGLNSFRNDVVESCLKPPAIEIPLVPV